MGRVTVNTDSESTDRTSDKDVSGAVLGEER